MGLLGKLRGTDKDKTETTVHEAPPCLHTALVPRWDSVDDMGHEDKATSFYCEGCGQTFSPAEAEGLKHTNTLELIGQQPVEAREAE